MYGRQTVKVKLPFAPASVKCDNPQLMIGDWSYADGFLTMDVRGVRLTGETGTITISDAPSVQPDWAEVNDFLYQLQNLSLLKAGASRFDLVITDYSRERPRGDALHARADRCPAAQPGRRQARPRLHEHRRGRDLPLVLEEERGTPTSTACPDRGAPPWLGRSNPDWLDNYKVRFWDPGWQKIIYGTPDSYLDKIIADGYDGVYLDIIDAYEYWGPGGEGRPVRKTAAQDMVDFVTPSGELRPGSEGQARLRDLPAERRRPGQAPRVHGGGHRHRPGRHLVQRRRYLPVDGRERAGRSSASRAPASWCCAPTTAGARAHIDRFYAQGAGARLRALRRPCVTSTG